MWTWPLFLCLELYACTHTHTHMYTHMHTHTYTHANRRALYVVSGGEAVRPCTGGTGKSRREGPEVEPGLASWGAWPAARQLENRLDSGGTTWPMDPDLETVQMWWGCGRHSGCPLGDGCPLKVETHPQWLRVLPASGSWLPAICAVGIHLAQELTRHPPIKERECVVLSGFSRVRLLATPWMVARQASLSVGLSRQEHWSGCHFLLQGIFPNQGSNPYLMPPALAGRFFTMSATWDAPSQGAVHAND